MSEFEPAPAPKGGATKWVIAGCCSCLLLGAILFAVVVGLGAQQALKAVEEYKVEARAFVDEAASNPDAAYARFSAPLKAKQTLEEFRAGVQANPDLFAVQDISINGVKTDLIDVGGGPVQRVRIKGTITSKSGAVRNCAFAFVEENGTRRLVEYLITPEPIPD